MSMQSLENSPVGPERPDGSTQVPSPYVAPRTAWDHPQVVDAIASGLKEIPEIIKQRMATEGKTEHTVTVGVLWWSGVLVAVIVLVVGVLTWVGKMSSDATTFLLGVLVGAAFSFVRDFFPNSH